MTVICIAEDRSSEEIAVKFLLLSLSRHCPDIKTIVTFPPATEKFQKFTENLPNIELRTTPIQGSFGWNVKPQAMLSLFEEGYEEVWWIDSDIILNDDFRNRLENFSDLSFLVAEEPKFGGYVKQGKRTEGWGFKVGNLLPFCPNSGVIRACSKHVPLLERWKELLESDVHRKGQSKPFYKRPLQMRSDQDVLTSLLESREFSWVSVEFLRRGRDIVQDYCPIDYSLKERLTNLLFGLPPFIHSQGLKPWWALEQVAKRVKGWEFHYRALMLDISPYKYVAASYRDEIDEDVTWLNTQSMLGILLKVLGLGQLRSCTILDKPYQAVI